MGMTPDQKSVVLVVKLLQKWLGKWEMPTAGSSSH